DWFFLCGTLYLLELRASARSRYQSTRRTHFGVKVMRHRKCLLLICVFMISTISAFAQSERRPEVFLGYSNLQAQGLPDTNTLTGIFGSSFFNDRTTMHGFGTEVSGFLSDNFGVTGSFSFNENNQSNNFFIGTDSLKTDIFYFMGGP